MGEGHVLGLGTSYTDKVVAVTLAVILIVVFVIFVIYIRSGSEFWYSLEQPTYAPPAWLHFTLLAAATFILWYGGTVLMTQSHPDDRAICVSLWVASLIVLFGTFVTFFQRELIVETSYLLMLFLALHVSLTYKLQFINGYAAILYGIGAVVMVYLLIVMTELIRLNPNHAKTA